MGWRAKREILPGGRKGVLQEIALSEQQVRLTAVPELATQVSVLADSRRRTALRAADPLNRPGDDFSAPRSEHSGGQKFKPLRKRL